MSGRFAEQKCEISLFSVETSNQDHRELIFTSQWNLISCIVTLLKPFEQLTREVSSTNACLSIALPAIQAILLYLQNDVYDEGNNKTVAEVISLFSVEAGNHDHRELNLRQVSGI